MRHLVDHRKLGRTASHRKALLRNMATSLILSERMETTLPKAKELRRVADELITLGKEGTLHARRMAARILQSDDALRKLFDGLAARFKDRQGGYTRIYKFGFRRGDSAEMAAIEYLGYQLPVSQTEEEKKAQKKSKTETKKETKKEAKSKPEKKTVKKEKKENKERSGKKGKWGLFGGKSKEKE